jgi:hypothetical protein
MSESKTKNVQTAPTVIVENPNPIGTPIVAIGRPKFSARTFTVALTAAQVAYLLAEFPQAKSIAFAVRSLIDDCAGVK